VTGRRGAGRDGGFTLIELLVAMTILALIAIVAVSGLQMIGQAWAKRQSVSAALDQQSRALDVLRRELGRAMPLDWGTTQDHLVAFDGEADRLRFVNTQGIYRATDTLVIWEFEIEAEGGGSRLLVRRAEVGRDGKAFAALEETDPRELFRVPQRLSFAYFGTVTPRVPPAWQDSWSGEPRLPMAVRLAAKGAEEATGLVIPLLIDTPVACVGASGASAQCG
jgi:prepilin-type N-terminal cleavage/methylation domain-containing protein